MKEYLRRLFCNKESIFFYCALVWIIINLFKILNNNYDGSISKLSLHLINGIHYNIVLYNVLRALNLKNKVIKVINIIFKINSTLIVFLLITVTIINREYVGIITISIIILIFLILIIIEKVKNKTIKNNGI